MKAMRLALVVSAITTFVAGLYFILYIYRWEMHRALIAGVVFLAGEIALATSLVIRRIETLRAPAAAPAASAAPAVSPPAPAPVPAREPTAPAGAPFPWLGADRFGVFVPILLGAGTIVSGVAWVVEHLARTTGSARSSGGRLERRLLALTPPPLVATVGVDEPVTASSERVSKGRLLTRVAAALVIAALATVLLTLALLGRSRTDPAAEGTRSVITMEVRTRNGVDVDVAARSLWGSCHVWVPSQQLAELRSPQAGLYEIVLEPALGEQAERRLLGCLNDGTLERVHAELRGHERIEIAASGE